MAINNTEQIRSLLNFPNENSFYFLEIIKRRKENPDLKRHAKLIRDFYIFSLEEFDNISEQVIELCEEHNARAYFRLNVRDAKKIAFQYNKRISELLITEDYKAIPKAYASVVGEFHHDPDKKWLIDIDGEDSTREGWEVIKGVIKNSIHVEPVITRVPTKNGEHIICRPFRLDVFKKEFPKVDVHKDNPTILYVP